MPTIQAAVVREKSGPFSLEAIHLEEPREDEILVQIHGTGVCHTDIVVRDQYFPVPLPAVLGHEGAGVVTRVGKAVTKVAEGDHVVLSYASCGTCANCQRGLYGYCPQLYERNFSGGRPDGSSPCSGLRGERISACFFAQSSFAQFALAPARNVVKIPADVPLHLMGPLGCGIQTGAGAVINALKPAAGTSLAVFGVGSVGLAAVMAAKLVGCTTIVAIDLNEARLKLARELGATHTIYGGTSDAVKEIRVINGEGVQYSIECTGVPAVVSQAVDCLRLTGVCGLVGVSPLGTRVSLDMNAILFGRTVRGIIEGDSVPDIFIPQLIELWRQGRFPFDKLIQCFPLSEINAAVRASERGEVLKAVVRPAL
jgi:aryl-alcohol dehydrogenase